VRLRSWLGLVATPAVAIATVILLYSLVIHSCGPEARLHLHIAAAAALAVAVVLAVVASSEASMHRGEPVPPTHDEASPRARLRKLADLAVAVSVLSCLVILGTWLVLWLAGPCRTF
jgi:hypothetical protein